MSWKERATPVAAQPASGWRARAKPIDTVGIPGLGDNPPPLEDFTQFPQQVAQPHVQPGMADTGALGELGAGFGAGAYEGQRSIAQAPIAVGTALQGIASELGPTRKIIGVDENGQPITEAPTGGIPGAGVLGALGRATTETGENVAGAIPPTDEYRPPIGGPTALYKGGQLAGGLVPIVGTGAVGGPGAAAALIGAQSTGQSFEQFTDQLEQQGYDKADAKRLASYGAVGYGLASGVSALAPLGVLFQKVPGLRGQVVRGLEGALLSGGQLAGQDLLNRMTQVVSGIDPQALEKVDPVELLKQFGLGAAMGGAFGVLPHGRTPSPQERTLAGAGEALAKADLAANTDLPLTPRQRQALVLKEERARQQAWTEKMQAELAQRPPEAAAADQTAGSPPPDQAGAGVAGVGTSTIGRAGTSQEISDAGQIGQTAAVHGDVLAQPIGGEGQVPPEVGGGGVQPQAPEINAGQRVQAKTPVTPTGEGKGTATFTTARGSTYEFSDGKTTRTKAARPEHPDDAGLKEQSEATLFMSPDNADEVSHYSNLDASRNPKMSYSGNNLVLEYDQGPKRIRKELPFTREPSIGKAPVEMWKDALHVGNEITDLKASPSSPGEGKQPTAAMGAAAPGELNRGPIAIKNERIDLEREARGLPPLVQPIRRSDPQVWDEATRKIEANPSAPDMLIAELGKKPRAIEDWEDAMLGHRAVDLTNQLDQTAQALDAKTQAGDTDGAAAARFEYNQLLEQFKKLGDASKAAGTAQGRALRWRQVMINQDFTLERMVADTIAAKGDVPMTPADYAKVKAEHENLQRLKQAAEKSDESALDRQSFEQVKLAFPDIQKKATQPVVGQQYAPIVLQYAEKFASFMDKAGDAAWARFKARNSGSMLKAGIDPADISDLTIYTAAKIARGLTDFAKWSDGMIRDVGEHIRPHLQSIWNAGHKSVEENLRKATADRPDLAKRVKASAAAPKAKAKIVETLKESQRPEDVSMLAREIAEEQVRGGVTELRQVIRAVHDELKQIVPEITPRETMDAISGYGKFTPPTKDAVKLELTDLRRQGQQTAKLHDMREGRPPLKTGKGRPPPSDKERRLTKVVNNLKKKLGFDSTDPARQLRSAMDSMKTRLTNQIADLSHQITTKSKIVKNRIGLEPDAEARALMEQRDELRRQYDEIFGPPELTPEQRIGRAEAALRRTIDDFDKVKPPPEAAAWSPAIADMRAELEKLRAGKTDDPAAVIERAEAAAGRAVQNLEEQIAAGGVKDRTGAASPWSAKLADLKAQQAKLRETLAEMRPKRAARELTQGQMLERAMKASEESLKKWEARLTNAQMGVFPGKKSMVRGGAYTEELGAIRARRDALRAQVQELKALADPKRSPDEVGNARLQSYFANRTAELQEKLARGDFATKPKRKVNLTSTTLEAKAAYQRAQSNFRLGLEKHRLANRTLLAKLLDRAIIQPINLTRSLMTTGEFSYVLRQGGWMFNHPIRTIKALPEAFRAFKNEHNADIAEAAIMERENAKNGNYERDKLSLTQDNTPSRQEEAFMGRWSSHLPVLSNFERFSRTFMNRVRADSYDALVATLTRTGEATAKEGAAIANYVNAATGRTRLPGKLEAAATGLNNIFFAPKFVASRFQLLLSPLTGFRYGGGSLRTRKLIAQEYARTLASLGTFYALASAAGADIETDPRSSDFGKVRFGNTRLDPLMGLSQITTFLTRLGTGETKNSKGAIVPIRGPKVPYGGRTSLTIMADFLRSKLAPVPGAAVDFVQGENMIGRPFNIQQDIGGLVTPITYGDIYQAFQEQGIEKGAALGLLTFFGMGLQTRQPKNQLSDEQVPY